eukprot:gnl/TRDRNA2_/TRDRNA2_86622_c0_seq1.p1 gnl/TRDRNA2_/TRDRNA2_86622_c0~~gnl/TRDRNA2_/TRDRNA2_86622_c0_seq1.p1  ORF type:complete len:158 (-),score=14.58 gnl/TRDRNA2_/TRDRNA2_86622_c0_seq1:126-599(-)
MQLIRSMAHSAQVITVMFLQVAVALCSWMPSRLLIAATTQLCRHVVNRWTERRRRACQISPQLWSRLPRSPRGHDYNGLLEEFRPRSAGQCALLVVQIAMTLISVVAFTMAAFGMKIQEHESGCVKGLFSPRMYAFACVFFAGALLNCRTYFSIPMV